MTVHSGDVEDINCLGMLGSVSAPISVRVEFPCPSNVDIGFLQVLLYRCSVIEMHLVKME